MISALMLCAPPVVFTNNTAVKIRPPIPRTVSSAPKILLIFIFFNYRVFSCDKTESLKYGYSFKVPGSENKHIKLLLKYLSDMYILQVMEKSKCFKKPDNNNYNNHNVEDCFDCTFHGDVPVDKP